MKQTKKPYIFGDNAVDEFVYTGKLTKVKDIKKRGFCKATIKKIIPVHGNRLIKQSSYNTINDIAKAIVNVF